MLNMQKEKHSAGHFFKPHRAAVSVFLSRVKRIPPFIWVFLNKGNKFIHPHILQLCVKLSEELSGFRQDLCSREAMTGKPLTSSKGWKLQTKMSVAASGVMLWQIFPLFFEFPCFNQWLESLYFQIHLLILQISFLCANFPAWTLHMWEWSRWWCTTSPPVLELCNSLCMPTMKQLNVW